MSDEKWPHADLAIQWYSAPKGTLEWSIEEGNTWLSHCSPSWNSNYKYKFRPIRRTEIMPEARVPAPLRVAPENGSAYFTINSAFTFSNYICRYCWYGTEADIAILGSGLAFATEQDARDFLTAITARREE